MTGLLVGGAGGGFIGSNAAADVEKRVERRLNEVEVGEQKNFDIIIAMSERLVRIETKLDAMKED